MIISFAGKKQSGKSTCCNILHGIVLKERGMISGYSVGENGELIIKSSNSPDWRVFDITRKDEVFVEYAEKEMWPYVKVYSFADYLKTIAIQLFNIPHKNVYGTDKDKNEAQEHLLWENMPGVVTGSDYRDGDPEGLIYHPSGAMTAREFLQYLGTDIMRKIWEPVWCHSTIQKIIAEDSELSVVCDVRFPNEVDTIRKNNGYVFWLDRNIYKDYHSSENALSLENYDHNNFDGVIVNQGDGKDLASLKSEVENLYNYIKNNKQ